HEGAVSERPPPISGAAVRGWPGPGVERQVGPSAPVRPTHAHETSSTRFPNWPPKAHRTEGHNSRCPKGQVGDLPLCTMAHRAHAATVIATDTESALWVRTSARTTTGGTHMSSLTLAESEPLAVIASEDVEYKRLNLSQD